MIDLAKIKDESEDIRRWEIIEVSKKADSNSLDILLEIVDTESSANKRHIVRALGNIGGLRAEEKLLTLASSESGEVLGDICKSLGQLRSAQAIPLFEELQDHEIQWVSQNARWAIKEIENDS